MVQQTVTVTLPEDFYQRVKVRAEYAHHSVEEELLTLAVAALDSVYLYGNSI